MRNEFRQEVAIRDLFKYSTIRSLSGRLSSGEERGSVIKIGVQSPRPDRIPLSYSQERLWFIDQLEGSVQYHIPWVLRLHGIVEAASLEKSLRTVVNRHEVLRTVIEQDEEGHAYQRVLAGDQWELGVHDMRGLSEDEIRRVVSGLTSSPFELSSSHKLRGDLLRIGAEEHILVLTLHHIASDGWSTPILIRELVELYNSSVGGRPAQLPPLPVQYSDYAIWQREYLSGDRLELKLGYWKERLNGVSPLLLPTDYVRPAVQSSRGRSLSFDLGASLSSDLRQLCQETGTTLFMSLLSVFNVLLSRYSGQDDICVGSVIANRGQSEVEGLIGFFVNTLALRTDLSGSPSFREVLGRVREVTLGAYEHQDVPFERVVEQVVHERDMSRSPLFQVMFVLQNNEREGSSESLSGLEIVSGPSEHTTSKYDLTFTLTEEGGQIRGTIEYCTDLYTAETAERMGDHYARLAGLLVSSPDVAVGTLEMLSAPELGMIVEEFNSTATVYPSDVTVVDLFESQVLLSGSSVAVVYEGESLSYSELDARSNALGHYLRSRGVREDTLVGICIDRSLEMIVGLLGILKAGGAYVPIDPDYPQDRIAYMLEDTGSRLLLSSSRVSAGLSMVTEAEVVELDRDWAKIASYGSLPVERSLQPTHLAYVIYTSGSTGTPKGVMVEHRNAVNLVYWHNENYEVSALSIGTSLAGFGFDAFGWEIWPYLAKGASIHMISKEVLLSMPTLLNLYIKQNITHSFVNTSLIPEFIKHLKGKKTKLKYLLTGGGQLFPIGDHGLECVLVNNYGPTENTVVATSYKLANPNGLSMIPIGRPISNTEIYILDKAGRVQPVGVPGELYIGGAGVARGYLNRPELTSERFVPNPYSKDRGSRLYRTGDQGRWLADGNIEYLGRLDDQVKIRGYRIELGEIESVLQQCPGVQQGVVLARPDAQGNRRLVGYVVAGEGYDQEVLRTYLQSKLPEYMVPSLWVELASLPLTSNGKTDRRSLPDPDLSLVRGNYEAPVTELEEQLAQIWQELLGVERVGVHDNFFELGGHSLLATRLISRMRTELGIEYSIKAFFKCPNIKQMVRAISIHSANTLIKTEKYLTIKL
ncbi:non-ribosomal peptide synthetase [Mucilaginibacter sp. P25]|uniref:non-ribosomal peptide synthetase n=1 Tax=Mucilaginibacter sp. P25 TaxID=3423945 RepID=UPI003D79E86B